MDELPTIWPRYAPIDRQPRIVWLRSRAIVAGCFSVNAARGAVRASAEQMKARHHHFAAPLCDLGAAAVRHGDHLGSQSPK